MSTTLAGDPDDMMNAVLGLPDHFELGAASARGVGTALRGATEVLVCGMGGSALPGDFLQLYAAPRGVRVEVVRDYEVRHRPLGPHVLAICSSYSGTTEETLSVFEQVRAAGCRVATVSAGGILERDSRAAGLPHVHLDRPDPMFQPRAAMGFFFGAFVTLLDDAGLLQNTAADLEALVRGLRGLTDIDAQARRLARTLAGRIPVLYASDPFVHTAARVAKIKFNENSKMPAFFNGLPELNHNELVGFTQLTGPFTAVMLRDPDLQSAMVRRFDVTAETLRDVGVPVEIVEMVRGTPELKLFATLHLFDVASVHLALDAGIDPTPVAMVEDFKRRLVERAGTATG